MEKLQTFKINHRLKNLQLCLISFVTFCPLNQLQAQVYRELTTDEVYANGVRLLNQRKCSGAVQSFTKYLQFNPTDTERVDAVNEAIEWCNKNYPPKQAGLMSIFEWNVSGLYKPEPTNQERLVIEEKKRKEDLLWETAPLLPMAPQAPQQR